MRNAKAHNDTLIKEKAQITQAHIQEAYQTNMSLHRRTTELEQALREAEHLLREKTQLVRELEEIPKIPISLDDQLEAEHRLILESSSNIVNLALEDRTIDQILAYYFNALTSCSAQYSVDLTQPLHSNQLTLLLDKYTYPTHPIIAMSFFRGDLALQDQIEIYQLPMHPIVLNFRAWCRCIQE